VKLIEIIICSVSIAAFACAGLAQNPATGGTTTGQGLQVEITPPAVVPADICDEVLVDATATLTAASPTPVNFLYVSDLSGSMEMSPFVPGIGDCNGDGVPNTKLDALCFGLHALNQSLLNPAHIEVGLVGFAEFAALADMQPLAGQQNFTGPPQVDASGSVAGVPDIEEVITSMDTSPFPTPPGGTIRQFTLRPGLGYSTNYTLGLRRMNDAFDLQPAGEINVAFFLSDGQPTVGGSFAGELARASAAGTTINTFAIGTGAGGCNPGEPLGQIAAVTGGSCTVVVDPALLAAVLPVAATTRIDSLTVTVGGVPVATTTGSEPIAMSLAGIDIAPNLMVGSNVVEATAHAEDGTSVTAQILLDAVGGREDPTIHCPAVVMADAVAGLCGADVAFVVTADDDCGIDRIECTPASGSFFAIGATQVACTAYDLFGNTADCTFDVVVSDVTPPTINCPGSQQVGTDSGLCGATASYTVTADDDCAFDRVECTPATGSFLPVGTTQVSCTAYDVSGNTAMCMFEIEVVDDDAPMIHCPSGTQVIGTDPGVCEATASYQVTADDNCMMASLVCTPASGSVLPVGVTQVSCIATDVWGNTSQCSFDVRVEDQEAPSVVCNSGDQLWPPNHKFEEIAIGYVDNCDAPGELSYVINVTSDEHPSLIVGAGGRIHCPDAIVHGDGRVELRRERSGTEDGRVYNLGIRAIDRAGNEGTGHCLVGVPHDQSGPDAVPSASSFDATDCGSAPPGTHLPPAPGGGGRRK